ncbi:MAG: hypothetical protein ACLFV7_07265 [Phycisphaerae bacterium]
MSARSKGILVGGAVLVILLVMLHVLSRYDLLGLHGSGLPDSFRYNQKDERVIDPKLLQYHQMADIPTGLSNPRDLHEAPDGKVYVVGDQAVRLLNADGSIAEQFATGGEARCIDLASDGTIFLGVGDHVEVYSPAGQKLGSWEPVGDDEVVTGIAVDGNEVFYGAYPIRKFFRCDRNGTVLNPVAVRDPADDYPGLKAPSPYLSVAVDDRGLVWINNPGHLRIEAHTRQGEFQHAWGKSLENTDAKDIAAFPGCCNPIDFDILPDGRFVTAEKGKNLQTVKVFQKEGFLEAIVVPSGKFAPTTPPMAVAADAEGGILVLDPWRKSVRVFELKQK